MIRLFKVVTALLPLSLLGVIGFVFYSSAISNWYAIPLGLGVIPLIYCCWRLEPFTQHLIGNGQTIADANYWHKLRFIALASLCCVALMKLALNASFRDAQGPNAVAAVASHISSSHWLVTFISSDDFSACIDGGGSFNDCTPCFDAPSEFDPTQPAIQERFGPVSVSRTPVSCRTIRTRIDGLSSLSCSFLMQWIDTGWLSRVTIAEHAAITEKFNRDFTELCNSSSEPISINVDYTYPPVMDFMGTPS